MKLNLRYMAAQLAVLALSVILISGAHAGYQTPLQFLNEQQAAKHEQPGVVAKVGQAIVGTSLRFGFKAARGVYRAAKVVVSYPVDAAKAVASYPVGVISTAVGYLGTNPTGMAHDWCAVFANHVLAKSGYATSGSANVASFAHYGPRLAGPVPGAIAVLPGHVGFVERVEGNRVLLVSGNNRHCGNGRGCTARTSYDRRSFVAFVMPRRTQMASLAVDQK